MALATTKVALVTGAARGIGRAIALRLAHDGLDIAVNDVTSSPELDVLVQEIESKGRRSLAVPADISLEPEVEKTIQKVVQELGSLNVMVANAGIINFESFMDTTVENFDRSMAVNARGTMLCYKYAGKQMISQGRGGRIIGACSLSGKQGHSIDSSYCASKFAIRGLTQGAAQELGKYGITVNAYAPGPVKTAMNFFSREKDSFNTADKMKARFGPLLSAVGVLSAVNRIGTPEDIADLVSYLASDGASFVTGTPPLSLAMALATTKVALVTGAARGIGRAIALRLAHDGLDVAVNDIASSPELDGLVREIESKGRRSLAIPADISLEPEVEKAVQKVVQDLGGLDVMVANAGIVALESLLKTTVENFDRLMAVNVRGTMLCYKHAGKQMVAQGHGGRIIGACSIAGKQAIEGDCAYSASKFAIRGLTQSSARELGKYGITVNAYAPGAVKTALTDELKARFGPDALSALVASSVVNRLGTPEEIADLVSYLASDGARFVTGQTICVDGGSFFD
ncbi:hypothetical protein V8E53_012021 [Lactarius tabidus]